MCLHVQEQEQSETGNVEITLGSKQFHRMLQFGIQMSVFKIVFLVNRVATHFTDGIWQLEIEWFSQPLIDKQMNKLQLWILET